MKIQELEKQLFGNILQASTSGRLINKYGFEFDGYIDEDEHEDGKCDKIECLITADGEKIPVEDFIIYDKEEFEAKYPFESAKQSFKNFRDKYVVLSGYEILTYYREKIAKYKKQNEIQQKVSVDNMICGGF